MLLLFVFWCESFHLQTASQCVKRNPAKAATSCNGRRPGCSSWNDGLLLLLSKTHKQKQIILICFKQNAEKQALQRPWKSTEMYQCKTVLHQNSIVFSIKEEIEKTNYVRKLQRKGFPCQEKKKKKVCHHPKPFSGHSFTIYFTVSRLLKRSIILTSWVLQEDTSNVNTEVIVSYLSMNLATHYILLFYHLYFNIKLTKQSIGVEIPEEIS